MSIKTVRYLLLIGTMLSLIGCSSLEEEDKYADLPATTLLSYARTALDDGDFEEAINLYRELESRFPYGKPAEQAQLDVAYAYYKNEEPQLAVAAADRFIRLHPTHERVDYAFYLKGIASYRERTGYVAKVTGTNDLSNRDTKPAQDAYSAFRELVTRFPNSPYADDARQRMVYMVNVLARHDISVARYYLSHGAYVAVLNRTKKVVEEYQRTPSVEDALGLMAIAYREMGLTDLMTDTVRILEKNFPESPYLAEIKADS
ncbi:MAG: outer membrane protein assembly factor BamD [marine bacterium B5-7]|nr:MAG: outer membrane protein assembly factor BamD [marine bacterium B5-7]